MSKNKRNTSQFQGEFKSNTPPNFDGESEEGAEGWLLNMSKYFRAYNYLGNLKIRLDTYQLNGKETLWWEENKSIKKIQRKNMTWKIFKKEFKNKYLTKIYFDEKTKNFHELRLELSTMDVFVNKFMS